ncbi:MAG: murein transglycosylase A [Rhodospirillaceae bacterium]|nr:murein transglycosylase A [Rhodospirillaceae bacterium]
MTTSPTTLLRYALTLLIGLGLGSALTYWLARPVAPPPGPPPAPPPALTLTPRAFSDLPGWSEDALLEARPALEKSCARLAAAASANTDSEKTDRIGSLEISKSDWRAACERVLAAPREPGAFRQALMDAFVPYGVGDGEKADGLFTGYYEATLRGSLTREGPYQVPLYGLPRDLINVVLRDFIPAATLERADVPATVVGRAVNGRLKPYFTRADIDGADAIAGQSEVIAWVDDAVDAHILHIQGSGQVTLPDGRMMRVGFAGHNGHAFRGLGRILIDEGAVDRDNASMIAIREWLKKNPARAAELMNRNARYIFFRAIEGDGPIGAQNVALTPGRSLAVDRRHIPLGTPLWLDSTGPDGEPLQRLMVAQDVGAAITGVVRGDFFWGSGEGAFAKAARMKSPGRYFALVPKTAQNQGKP